MDEAYQHEVDRLEHEYNKKLDEAKKNIVVLKCGFCGKFFIRRNLHESHYCSVKCQQKAFYTKMNEQVSNNPILKEHRRAVKRMQARKARGLITKEQYDCWFILSKNLLSAYKSKYENECDINKKMDIINNFIRDIKSPIRKE